MNYCDNELFETIPKTEAWKKTTATAFRTSPKSPNCGGTISQCVLSVPSTREPLFTWQHKILDEKWSTCEQTLKPPRGTNFQRRDSVLREKINTKPDLKRINTPQVVPSKKKNKTKNKQTTTKKITLEIVLAPAG